MTSQQLQEAGWASRKDEPYKPLGGRIILDMPHPSQILRHATEDDARDQLILGAQAFKASKILDRRAKARNCMYMSEHVTGPGVFEACEGVRTQRDVRVENVTWTRGRTRRGGTRRTLCSSLGRTPCS